MAEKESARLAIIGCGAIVQSATVPALRRIGWSPQVLIDLSPKRLDAVAKRMGSPGKGVIRAAIWETVSSEFEAAIVALPHTLHGPIGASLVKSGKHVFMEKPLAITADECRVMTTAAETGGTTLSVGLLRRYLHIGRWTKALLESRILGEVEYFEAREGFVFSSDPSTDALLRPNMAGGGVLIDSGAHTIDQIAWWFGDVASVQYRDDSEGGVEADCVLECRLNSGASGRIVLSRTRELRNSIRIEGTKGFVEVHLYRNEILDGSPNALAFTHNGIRAADLKPQFPPELFEAELRDFRQSASGGKRVGISGGDGTKSVELIERCYRARQPLQFPWLNNVSDHSLNSSLESHTAFAGKRVLITGASGFIGGRLAERLVHDGAHVRCAIHSVGRATRVARLPVEIAQIDLGNFADVDRALDGVEYVFHCAYDPRSRSQNVDGLRNLIDACASHSVRRLVHVSTFAVYEPFPDGPLTEETRDGDRSMVYVKIKLDLEKIVFEMAHERKVPATIVQPSIVYGPFCKPWTNAVAEMLIYGKLILPDSGEGLCNAVYIDDLIDGLILAAASGEAVGERFILSGPEPVSWATFFNGFADALGLNPPDYWPRAKIVQANRSISRNVRAILADPRRFIKIIANWGPTRQTLRAGADALPAAIRSTLMNYYYAGGAKHASQAFLPDSQTLSRYSFRAAASNQKAEIKLGYRPKFTFERGMALTSSYLKWAYGDILRSVQPVRRTRTLPTQKGCELPTHQSEDSPGAPILLAAKTGSDQVPDTSQERPLVSVIIPVFNRAKSLPVALDSVARQSFTDWEIVVVDDCSSDDSVQVALRGGPPGKVRVVSHERNQGSSAARNTGIRHARGKYVSFLDSDDRWHPDKLKSQVELVEADPDPSNVFCATQTRVVMDGGRVLVRPERPPAPDENWSEFLYVAGGFAQTNSFFLSRELALKVLFDPEVPAHVDNLFFLKAGALGARYRLVEEPLSIWNHDLRPDRISLSPHFLEQSRKFLAKAGALLTEKAHLAFEARYLGPLLFRENPLTAIGLFRRAFRQGAVMHRHLLAISVRCILPASAVAILRRYYAR